MLTLIFSWTELNSTLSCRCSGNLFSRFRTGLLNSTTTQIYGSVVILKITRTRHGIMTCRKKAL